MYSDSVLVYFSHNHDLYVQTGVATSEVVPPGYEYAIGILGLWSSRVYRRYKRALEHLKHKLMSMSYTV